MSEAVITEITIYPIKPTNKGLIGFAACIFNNQLSLSSIAIYTRPDGKGFRLVYPTRKLLNGKEVNVFYPINKETGDQIQKSVMDKLNELRSKYSYGEKNYSQDL